MLEHVTSIQIMLCYFRLMAQSNMKEIMEM